MRYINLNKEEYSYLCHASFLEERYRALFSSHQQDQEGYLVKISKDLVGELLNLCGDRFQITGFNAQYELTQEGQILESLLDKFFIRSSSNACFTDKGVFLSRAVLA